MAKRGYKLQEFVAHSSNVNCLSIGKKACRLFLTGGDDNKVNLWSIGKPNSLMSLCGHACPVESVAFDTTEVLVLGGASSGVIKLWDLEEAKMVRGLTGHRSNCTAVECHPFGEFFASGSTDTNLKLWDIRKKSCIHTYKGHTRGISTIKFTPDGRWVISGGYDSIVKVWDLTAGKLLHDFKFHENHIRSIHFHPLEFLMATGSADRTVKYWDLETFELIGSSRPEGSGVRAITFHPDGRTLFCGLEDSLKVYSWEPVVCHDTVDMGWSSLGDLCFHEGKLVGCSYYQNTVGVWAADTTLIKPFAKGSSGHQVDLLVGHSPAKEESGVRCTSHNYEAKEIKNIYVDTSDGKPVSLQRAGSVNSSKGLLPTDLKDNRNLAAESPRQGSVIVSPEKSNGHSKYLDVPNFVPDGSDERDIPHSRKDSVSFSRTKPGMLLRPAPSRKPSGPKYSVDRLTVPSESPDIIVANSISDCHLEVNSESTYTPENAVRLSSEGRVNTRKTVSRTMPSVEIPKVENESTITTQDAGGESSEEKIPSLTNISGKIIPVKTTKVEKGGVEPVEQSGESDSVKIVRGVAVMTGRTRTLVEKFEKRERLDIVEEQGVNMSSPLTPTMDSSPASHVDAVKRKENSISHENHGVSESSSVYTTLSPLTPTMDRSPASRVDAVERKENSISHENHGVSVSSSASTTLSPLTPTMDRSPASRVDAVERKENSINHENHGVIVSSSASTTLDRTAIPAEPLTESLRKIDGSTVTPTTDNSPTSQVVVERKKNSSRAEGRGLSMSSSTSTTMEMTPTVSFAEGYKRRGRSTIKVQSIIVVPDVPRVRPSSEKLVHEIKVMEEREPACSSYQPNVMSPNVYIEPVQSNKPQVSGRMESNSETFADVVEVLMQSHEVFISTLRSRLTKLQAVCHFWARKDMKGAINSLKRLPDHSVQADVISVLTEKMEILDLDLFSCLLPVLVGLLDGKIERHAVLSMEMLMKLIAVFGPVVRSTISARPAVGVDLHAEERLECCNQCWAQLQKTHKILPLLVRRGGLLAKSAQELNLVLQQL